MAQTNANLIWKIADLLRGPYQPNQYGDVILPFTILRRLDCILEPTKDEVLAEYKKIAVDEGRPRRAAEGQVQAALLQHLPLDLRLPGGRPGGGGRQPRRLHRALLAQRARRVRRLRDDRRDRQTGQVRPAVPDRQGVRRRRSAPQRRLRARHGLHLRRTHPQVRRVQLHPGR